MSDRLRQIRAAQIGRHSKDGPQPGQQVVALAAFLIARSDIDYLLELVERETEAFERSQKLIGKADLLLNEWANATWTERREADQKAVDAWSLVAAAKDPWNHCPACGYPLEQGRCYSCGGPHESPIGPGLIGDPAEPGDMP